MIENFERIDQKLDKIQDRLSSIDTTLALQHKSLDTHIKRSDSIEQRVEQVNSELKPVYVHVQIVNLLGKIALAVLLSSAFWNLIKYLF